MIKIKKALISVSDKTDLLELVKILKIFKVEIISTGGTKKYLELHKFKVTSIENYTNYPEILDGRVKTLHPKIYAGILNIVSNKEHQETMQKLNMESIDLIIVNLYPFLDCIKNQAHWQEAIENIDIGGPSMIRGGAKNYESTVVLSSTADYASFSDEYKLNKGIISEQTSLNLARKAFANTAMYDSCISNYFNKTLNIKFPEILNMSFKKEKDLVYGENPHQKAAYYNSIFKNDNISTTLIQGKELSFNNILDFDVAFEAAFWMGKNTVTIIKHNNPCGIAQCSTLEESFRKAFECDPVSAFGGIIGVNGIVSKELAESIIENFVEGVIAENFTEDALLVFQKKSKIRIVKLPGYLSSFDRKFTNQGILLQDKDIEVFKDRLEVVTEVQPSEDDLNNLLFAWKTAKFVKSNGIVLAKKNQTVGIGAGQMSRIDAVKLAFLKAKNSNLLSNNLYLASDAFFPFRDSIDYIASKNIKSIIQPGGSIRDKEVIEAANEHNISMVFTKMRHFRH